MAKLNQLIQPVLQVSSEHLHPDTLHHLAEDYGVVSNITYYKKEIGEEKPAGFFLVCDQDTLEKSMPDDIRLVLTLGAAMGAYYVEVDEMFEMCDLLPIYTNQDEE